MVLLAEDQVLSNLHVKVEAMRQDGSDAMGNNSVKEFQS